MQKVRIGYFLYSSKSKNENSVPLYVKIRVSGTVTSFSSGCSIPKNQWCSDTKRVKGKSTEALNANNRLKIIEKEIYAHAFALENHGKEITAQILRDYVLGKEKKPTIRDAMNDYISMIQGLIGAKYSVKTLEKYKQTQTRIIEFMVKHRKVDDLPLSSLSDGFLMDFENYVRGVLKNHQSTCAKHFQRFSTMIRYAKQKGLIDKFPFETYCLKPIQKEVTYLTMDEVNTLISTDFGESLNRVRDCFVFSIYTGLAYTELRNLHGNHIVTGFDGAKWIKMVRKKTQKEFMVPILPIAWNILMNYNPHGLEGKLLLPTISNVKINKYLKIIGAKCGIKTHITVHLARRTFAVTILMMNDVPIHVISETLGHSSTSVTIKAYTKVLPQMTKNHFDRLKNLLSE